MYEKGYIRIQNQGEMDIDALMLIGATNKRNDDSKIGFFGSGLKYSLAVLLRNKIPFHIFSGEKEMKITAVPKKFRGVQDLEVIKVNNRLTSFTTDMGPDWEPWFAVREIYCNAIDEGQHVIEAAGNPHGEKGKTTIYIANHPALQNLFTNWDEYFSDKRKDLIIQNDLQGTKVYASIGKKTLLYRKGVRCFVDEEMKSLYHYDLAWAKINESRVLSDEYSMRYRLADAWGRIATVEMINNLLDNYENTFERTLTWSYDACIPKLPL